MSAAVPGRLHVLTDETLQRRFTHLQLAELAARGGADHVQFREKRIRNTRDLLRLAEEMKRVVELHGARLVVNDRVDVALACGSSAVHLGREDMSPAMARRLLGARALLGGTANDLGEAEWVERQPVDYLGVGPVFATASKAEPAPVLGPGGLRRIVEVVSKPVIAIGGIDASNAGEVLSAGAHGLAVLSAVVCAPDPRGETRRLRGIIDAFVKHAETT
jgi:thiamine-phosphate pyrophosphorylase